MEIRLRWMCLRKKEDARNSHPLFYNDHVKSSSRVVSRSITSLGWSSEMKSPKKSCTHVGGVVQSIPYLDHAGVAEQADARDLKSLGLHGPCRFKSGLRHQAYRFFLLCQILSSLQPS